MIGVDLDSTLTTRRIPSSTRLRRAKIKSKIHSRLFSSSARLKGIMLDLY
jgi:hypothetical protein